MKMNGKYQFFQPLSAEERGALENDIRQRGVMVPIEVDEAGEILDGHHRVEIADRLGKPYKTITRRFKTEEAKREHVIKLNLCRRHLGVVEWGRAFKKLLEAKGVKRGKGARNDKGTSLTVREVAAEVGVPTSTAELRLKQADDFDVLPAKLQAEVAAKETTLKEAKTKVRKQESEASKRDAAKKYPRGGKIITGDMSLLFKRLDDNSVDLFFTDPPYHEDKTHLFGELAKLAQAKLKPGGLCLVYSGQMFLPTVLSGMMEHLDYWWIFAIRHTGGHLQIWNRMVWNDWKPVIVMAKRPIAKPDHDWVMDFIEGGGRDKRYHEWGQDAAEATYWIERLTMPGALIVDPFCGGGAIPVACKATGRRWLATELDKGTAAVARKRLMNDSAG